MNTQKQEHIALQETRPDREAKFQVILDKLRSLEEKTSYIRDGSHEVVINLISNSKIQENPFPEEDISDACFVDKVDHLIQVIDFNINDIRANVDSLGGEL